MTEHLSWLCSDVAAADDDEDAADPEEKESSCDLITRFGGPIEKSHFLRISRPQMDYQPTSNIGQANTLEVRNQSLAADIMPVPAGLSLAMAPRCCCEDRMVAAGGAETGLKRVSRNLCCE